jgi:hypothetical protein
MERSLGAIPPSSDPVVKCDHPTVVVPHWGWGGGAMAATVWDRRHPEDVAGVAGVHRVAPASTGCRRWRPPAQCPRGRCHSSPSESAPFINQTNHLDCNVTILPFQHSHQSTNVGWGGGGHGGGWWVALASTDCPLRRGPSALHPDAPGLPRSKRVLRGVIMIVGRGSAIGWSVEPGFQYSVPPGWLSWLLTQRPFPRIRSPVPRPRPTAPPKPRVPGPLPGSASQAPRPRLRVPASSQAPRRPTPPARTPVPGRSSSEQPPPWEQTETLRPANLTLPSQ